MVRRKLTQEEERVARELAAKIQAKLAPELLEIARSRVIKSDEEVLGAGEFELREQVLKLGAQILAADLEDRSGPKKGVRRS
jgi:hypothetical protein